MSPDLLHVVVPVFNPRRYRSHTRNTARFLEHMIQSGVRVTVAECTYGDAAPVFAGLPGINHIHLQATTVAWIKECLLNLAIQRLPRDWKYVAWIDADLNFHRPDWAAETVYALQQHDFVQPWEHCYDLGPHGEHMELHHSFGRQWVKEPETVDKMGSSGYRFAHPGYAWATRRSTMEKMGGLIETAVLGAADHHMALALVGKARMSIPGGMSEGYAAPILQWEERAKIHVAGNLHYVPGTISHAYHGAKTGRAYVSRWDILKAHAFDPATDLKRNTSGVLELSGNKPALRRDILAYFASRDEDASTIAAEMSHAA